LLQKYSQYLTAKKNYINFFNKIFLISLHNISKFAPVKENHCVMKTLISFFLMSLFFSFSAFSQEIQEKDLPLQISAAFKNIFPDAEKCEWKKDSLGFVVNFVQQGIPTSTLYNANGKCLRSDWELSSEYAPANIKKYIRKNFRKYKITKMFIEENTEGKFYQLQITKKENHHILFFTTTGEFVKDALAKNKIHAEKNLNEKKK
jgi:hypothetical protein